MLTGNIIYDNADNPDQRVAFGGADTGSGKTLTVKGDISGSGTGSFNNLQINGIGGAMLEVSGNISSSGDLFVEGTYKNDLKVEKGYINLYQNSAQLLYPAISPVTVASSISLKCSLTHLRI